MSSRLPQLQKKPISRPFSGSVIEPDPQTTQLLDATTNLQGVLLAEVPGAVGFDTVLSDLGGAKY
ncbi:hypothetical protein U9M48_005232 [Paspalum notatum var. saurae]|uniref:Uncharacterized protein n=1 Tax=Paspalum notatum var. saurae TaxID=547442 RepID=A0AAQ3PWG3_PASNO